MDRVLNRGAGAGGSVSPGLVRTFFDQADAHLFAAPQHKRKYLGFRLFEAALPRLDSSAIPFLFTERFVRVLGNSLANPGAHLHDMAKDMLKVGF